MDPVKGRGSVSNLTSTRFSLPRHEHDGDWLDNRQAIDGQEPKPRTRVTPLHPKTILSFNRSPDIPFDRSINAYNGCEHGCIYCFARPSHAFHDLSPGLDFETELFVKPDAAGLLRKALARPAYRCAPIAMGTNTDPYQPIESRWRLTRQVLEVCLETGHPVTITTKSDRILADLDLLRDLAARDLVHAGISITSLDPRLSQKLEPRAAAPSKRLAALAKLVEAGIPCHVSIAPIIPAITDDALEAIVAEASARGVRHAMWILVRLPHEVAPLMREWLEAHFPERANKVMAIIRSIRGGRDNDPRFTSRMRPQGVWPDLVNQRMRLAMRRHGMAAGMKPLTTRHFRPPDRDGQLSLL